MKKIFSICLIFFMLTGCGKENGSTEQDKSSATQTVVALLPLTGDLAFLGVPGQRAIQIALDDIAKQVPAKTPIHVEFVDTKADPKEAVTRYLEARAKYNAKYFITTLTGVSKALRPLIERDGAFQIMVAIHPKLLQGASNAVRFCFSAAQEAREIASNLIQRKGETIGLLVSKDATSVSEVEDYIIPALDDARMSYVRQDFDIGQKNFRSLLQSLVDKNVGTLVVLGYGSDLPGMLRQLAVIDPQGKIGVVGGIGLIEFPEWTSAAYLNRTLEFIGPSIAIDGLIGTQSNPVARKYVAKYGAKYMPYDAAFTYDAVMALSKAFGKGLTAPMQVRDEIISSKTYHGLAGNIMFSANGDVNTQMAWGKFQNGKLIKVVK